MALILAGCGASESDNSNKNKDFVVALTGDAVSLDPQNATDTVSSLITNQITDTLVVFNKDMEIKPSLAESWTVSDDGKLWTFKLRKEVTFQDGTPFNSEAVKISFDRLFNENKKLARYPLLGPYISQITADSELQVTFHLKNPLGSFLNNLAISASGIISPKSIEENEKGIAKKLVGTGPYTFKEWTPGSEIVLEANPDYWGGKPKVDTLSFKTVPENSARVLMLENGEVDVIDKVPDSDLERLKNNDQLKIMSEKTNRILYVGINNQKKPLNQVGVRQALNYAIDKETLANKLYGGNVNVSTAAVPNNMFGYRNVGSYPYDLNKAKQLLETAGVKPGTKLRFIVAENVTQDRKAAEYVQNSLQKLGFKVELKLLELGSYLETLDDPGAYDLFLRGAIGSTNDIDYMLRTALLTDSSGNYAHYSNPKVDDYLKKGITSVNNDERKDIYGQMLQVIKDDAPWIYLYEDMYHIGKKKDVSGVVFLPTYTWDFRQISK